MTGPRENASSASGVEAVRRRRRRGVAAAAGAAPRQERALVEDARAADATQPS